MVSFCQALTAVLDSFCRWPSCVDWWMVHKHYYSKLLMVLLGWQINFAHGLTVVDGSLYCFAVLLVCSYSSRCPPASSLLVLTSSRCCVAHVLLLTTMHNTLFCNLPHYLPSWHQKRMNKNTLLFWRPPPPRLFWSSPVPVVVFLLKLLSASVCLLTTIPQAKEKRRETEGEREREQNNRAKERRRKKELGAHTTTAVHVSPTVLTVSYPGICLTIKKMHVHKTKQNKTRIKAWNWGQWSSLTAPPPLFEKLFNHNHLMVES